MSQQQQQQETFESVVNRLIKENLAIDYIIETERFAAGRPILNIVVSNIIIESIRVMDKLFNVLDISSTENGKVKILIYGLRRD